VYFDCIHIGDVRSIRCNNITPETRTGKDGKSQDQYITLECPMRNKSDENWRVVSLCLQNGTLNAAANRLYYAVFQAVLGYAKAKQGYIYDPNVSAHSKMWQYVAADKGGYSYRRVFTKLMVLRKTADYEPETPTEKNIKSLMGDSGSMRQYFLKLAES